MTSHTRFWRASAAPFAAAVISLGALNANALTLGKVRVQSALGQSLVAEIDVSDLSEEDAKSIKTALASPTAFAGMGLEYNPALNGTQIALQRRPNGNRFLKLVNNRPLNDPFVDIVVELSWASGRIVRTYTILLDPPKPPENTSATALPATAVDTPTVAAAAANAAAGSTGTPAAATGTPTTAVNAAMSASAPVSVSAEGKRVRVRSGDTAGKIARSLAPSGVSVEQMLVALVNTNPTAFANGNVNRLVANADLVAPDSTVAKKTSKSEARRIVERQFQDFQTFRRSLASQAAPAPVTSDPTKVVGTVVDSTSPSAPKAAPSDTLKLSKESLQDKAEKASMEQIAQQRAKNEATERARELAKNIEELNQLAKVATKPEAGAAPSESAPAQNKSASEPAKSTSEAPAVTVAAAPEPATSQGSWLDMALQNAAAGGALLAFLAALGGVVWYRRKQVQRADASGGDGQGQWDANNSTAFDLGGGRRVDTTDANTTGLNTTMYPDSQLEMANELDPVAEAEVYLAYGKDVPAEEILKEGLQQDPTRVAIHLKLMGIFAKRRDIASFDAMALEVSALVKERGPEWAQVQEMGRSLAPSNPLYGSAAAAAGQDTQVSADGLDFQQSVVRLNAEPLQALELEQAGQVLANPKNDVPNQDTFKESVTLPSEAETQAAAGANTSFVLSSTTIENPLGAQSPAAASTDRLDATLALAEQFIEIGEKEGARALLEEVIAGSSEPLRERAKNLLTQVG